MSMARDEAPEAIGRGTGRAPDFVILGAQKAGTTSLYELLTRHPQVVPARRKEVHFLDRHWKRGIGWYRDQFPDVRDTDSAEPVLTGEATPYYLFHPEAPARLRVAAPEARLLVVLRDPVDRAYSHYQMQVRRGREDQGFARALALEAERLAAGPENHPRYSYVARGRYAEQLRRWFAVFPRERFLVIESGELVRRTEAVLAGMTRFLGIAPFPDGTRLPRRASGSYPPMPTAVRASLARIFAPHDERLRAMLGEPFAWNARSARGKGPTADAHTAARVEGRT